MSAKGPKGFYRSSGRKPYYSLGDSMKNFFSEPIRFIKESNTVESEFEKPYYDLQYNKMHLKWNIPDWEWEWGDWKGGSSWRRDCFRHWFDFCQIWTRVTTDPTTSVSQLVGGVNSTAYDFSISCAKADCFLSDDFFPGVFPKVPTAKVIHESSDTCVEDFDVEIEWTWMEKGCTEPRERSCRRKHHIFCSGCGDVGAIAFSSSSAVAAGTNDFKLDTNDTASPYTWTVGAGGSFSNPGGNKTSVSETFIDVDAGACTIVVSVEDACGQTDSMTLLVTGGGRAWVEDTYDAPNCAIGETGWCSSVRCRWADEYYNGDNPTSFTYNSGPHASCGVKWHYGWIDGDKRYTDQNCMRCGGEDCASLCDNYAQEAATQYGSPDTSQGCTQCKTLVSGSWTWTCP